MNTRLNRVYSHFSLLYRLHLMEHLLLEVERVTRNKEADDEAKEPQHGAEDLNHKNLDEPAEL